jgi:hypothetical protein
VGTIRPVLHVSPTPLTLVLLQPGIEAQSRPNCHVSSPTVQWPPVSAQEVDLKRLSRAIRRPFGSLPGLLVVVVTWEALIVASLAPFSGPLRPLGLAAGILAFVRLCDGLQVPPARAGEGMDGAPVRDRHRYEPASFGPLCRRPTDPTGLAESLIGLWLEPPI